MNYARLFHRRATPQSQPIPGSTQVPNSAGGYAWQVDDWTRFDRFLVLGAEGGTYYIAERDLIKENHGALVRCIQADGLRTVHRIVEISESGRAPKNDPAIFALALVAAHGQAEAKALAFQSLAKICRIGTHLFHFAEYVNALRGWGRGLRNAVVRIDDSTAAAICSGLDVIWTHVGIGPVSTISTPAEWNKFLKSFAVALGTNEWPGNPAASEDQLLKAESRLKTKLPPSYRAFLSTSNGWRNASRAVPRLRPIEKIRWFRKEHREWVQAYLDPMRGVDPLLPAEADYFNYAQEDSVNFDVKHLAQALCISDEGDSAVLLLNPMVVWPDGEWETWFFANWLPGATRYRSFADWMRHELADLLDETFAHSVVPGELPTVYLDGPAKAERRVRPREEILTFDKVLKKLSSKTRAHRVKAVRQLGRIGSQEAVTILLDLLKGDYDSHVRCEAANTLGRMRVEKAINPLIAAIDDDGVNTTAIHALSSFNDERSAECLLRILGEGGMYATSAAHVLGVRGDNRAIESLSRFLVSKDPRDKHIGDIAGRFIANFQGPGLAALEPSATDADLEVRRRAIIGLGDIAFGAKEKSVKEKARELLRKCLENETDSELRRLLEVEIEITTNKSA